MITQSTAGQVLEKALSTGGDFAELFLENRDELTIKRSDRETKGVSSAHIYGVGIYILSETQSVYAYTNDTSLNSLLRTAEKASELIGVCKKTGRQQIVFTPQKTNNPNRVQIYSSTIPHAHKIAVMEDIDLAARSASMDVKQVGVEYFDTDQRILIANSEGLWTEDRRVTSRIRLSPTLVNMKGALSRWRDFARSYGFEAFKNKDIYEDFAKELIRSMGVTLNAKHAPAAYMPVVIEAGCGVLFHEACGHGLESSIIAAGTSAFAGKLGEVVASEKVTLIDDGTIPGAYASAAIDDEGMPTQRNILIENGILKSYMADRLGARKLNVPRTGSGRRQGYTYAPASRMFNTYLAEGTDEDDEMISSMAEGLYVAQLGGGFGGAEFSLEVSEGYWVKNGKIDRPVGSMLLTGKGVEVLKKIDRVGKKSKLGSESFCYASSGLCTNTASQPRVRVSGMIVGGKG